MKKDKVWSRDVGYRWYRQSKWAMQFTVYRRIHLVLNVFISMIYFAIEIHQIQKGTDNPVITKVPRQYRPRHDPRNCLTCHSPRVALTAGKRYLLRGKGVYPPVNQTLTYPANRKRNPYSLGYRVGPQKRSGLGMLWQLVKFLQRETESAKCDCLPTLIELFSYRVFQYIIHN